MKNPLAALALIVAIIALIPLAISFAQFTTSDDIAIQPAPVPPASSVENSGSLTQSSGVPVEHNLGQLTAPSFMIPRPLQQIPRPPETAGSGTTAFSEWALDMGGVYANEMSVAFTVRGKSPELTLITDVRVEVVRRDKPLGGTWLAPTGAGSVPVRLLLVDLDEDPPVITRGGEEAWNFPLSVSSEDLELFEISASTETCDCAWRAVVDYVDADGDARQAIVDDNGHPFRVTSTNNATATANPPRTSDEPWPN